jgi:hypothetical protein
VSACVCLHILLALHVAACVSLDLVSAFVGAYGVFSHVHV